MPFLFMLLTIALMIGALIDIITRDDSRVRFLPKMVWLIIVILLPLIGSVLWFVLGREYDSQGVSMPRMPRRQRASQPPSPQTAAPTVPMDTRTTEQQIADLDREIEEWRLREEIEKRKQDRGEA
ncbi:PLDc N-terminal domain-containing protein [Microbacterium sp. GXF0217]